MSKGVLTCCYLEKDDSIGTDEFMYIHFWCRPMVYKSQATKDAEYIIWSDYVDKWTRPVTVAAIKRLGRKNPVQFYIKSLWFNRHKLTWKRIAFNLKQSMKKKKRGL